MHALADFPDPALLHRFRPQRYPHFLESVAPGTPEARFDILFAFPGSVLALAADQRLYLDEHEISGDFPAALDRMWRTEATPPAQTANGLPFTGGWFLYLGYELARHIEPALAGLPAHDGSAVAIATRFPAAMIRDHATRRAVLVCEIEHAGSIVPAMIEDVRQCPAPAPETFEVLGMREEEPALYLARIERALEYIRAGDAFQVNLSRAWDIELGAAPQPADLYRRLRQSNPAPFAGLASLGEGGSVISSSPEQLVCVRGDCVSTRPIAGTSPRSDHAAEDRAWSLELPLNPKERAEHVMLIDLERNDLGRICRPGSVRVSEMMRVTSYRHVHHLVSKVEGKLQPDVGPGEIIRAVFPGGTITGCPKIRTQQIIGELEKAPRGAYTGSMGYMNRDGSMDLNILIRTLVQRGRHIHLRAGGGIVADSQPQRELNETRAKAKGLLNVFRKI
ncbi:MAG: aminodeoxychorismate synthase component I [Acidiferrobacterales bacterium]